MTINQIIKYSAFIAFVVLLFSVHSSAQNRIQSSFNTGYHVINTDVVSESPNVSSTDWNYGGTLASQFNIRAIRFEINVGYNYGRSTIYEVSNTISFSPTYSLDLRYRTVPMEFFWVNTLSNRIELLAGMNMAFQDRTLLFAGVDIDNDRLFSMGVGLSGKIRAILNEFSSGNGGVFFDVSARWTEFVFHDSNGRNLDNFKLRHITLSPNLGIYYKLN